MLDTPGFIDTTSPLPCRVDPDLFFTPTHTARQAAARVCATCPAQAACAEYATNRPELLGIWGGLTLGARTQARRERQTAKETPDAH